MKTRTKTVSNNVSYCPLEKRQLLASLGNGQEAIGSLAVGQFETYDIQVESAGLLRVSVGETAGINANPAVELFDPSGNSLGLDTGSENAELQFNVTETGLYQAVVRENGNNDAYDYRIRALALPGTPELTPDRDAALASGEEFTGTLPVGGFSVFPIEVESQGTLRVSVGEISGVNANPTVELFDPSGNSLGIDTDTNNAELQVDVSAVGTYTAVVRESGNNDEYEFRVRALTLPSTPELIQDRDTVLANGEELTGTLPVGGFSVFPIEVEGQGTLRVSVGEISGINANPAVELFDPSGNSIGFDTGTNNAELQIDVSAIGTYTAVVRESGNNDEYEFRVRALTLPGTPELIPTRDTTLANGEEFTGTLPVGGFSVFPLSVGTPSTLRVSVGEISGINANPAVELFDPSGNSIGFDTGTNNAELQIDVSAIGTYTAVVRESGNNNEYEYRVQAFGLSSLPKTTVFFNTDIGILFLSGDAQSNRVVIDRFGADQIRVDIEGALPRFFDFASVNEIEFIGRAGDDYFENNTSIPSFAAGHDGNDQLIGGFGDDNLVGGSGDDIVSGRSGNDRLVGALGNDNIRGGNGNDNVFGTAGENLLFGDNGDDIIYGGNDRDEIYGNEGADQIFGLEGDDLLLAGNGGTAGGSVDDADLVLGHGGDDTIIGEGGLNILWGGNGNDTLLGGLNAENRLHGQLGDDFIRGGDLADFISAHTGNDRVSAGGGDDFIIAGPGENDIIHGEAGIDSIRFSGRAVDYRIDGNDFLRVRDLREFRGNTGQGTHQTSGVENYQFADGNQVPAATAIERVFLRPIVVSDDSGANLANFFGSNESFSRITNYVNDIFAQANIEVIFQSQQTYRDTFANRGDGDRRPFSDLNQIVNQGDLAGVGSSNVNVIDAYFVTLAPGQNSDSDNLIEGFGLLDSSGLALQIGDSLLTTVEGQKEIARITAREIARNLGVADVSGAPANLVDRSGEGSNINPSQAESIISSPISQP